MFVEPEVMRTDRAGSTSSAADLSGRAESPTTLAFAEILMKPLSVIWAERSALIRPGLEPGDVMTAVRLVTFRHGPDWEGEHRTHHYLGWVGAETSLPNAVVSSTVQIGP